MEHAMASATRPYCHRIECRSIKSADAMNRGIGGMLIHPHNMPLSF